MIDSSLKLLHEQTHSETDDADDCHASNHVMDLEEKAALLNQVAEPGLRGYQFSRDHTHPSDAQCNSKRREHHGECWRNDHVPKQQPWSGTETQGCIDLGSVKPANSRKRTDEYREYRTDEHQKVAGRISDAKPHNSKRDPCQGRNGAQPFDQGLE